MQRYKKYSIEEVRKMWEDTPVEKKVYFRSKREPRIEYKRGKILIDNKITVNMNSDRYKVFFEKGTTCVNCGLEGQYFWLEAYDADALRNVYHFNLYGLDKDGNEILMTKDHIVPKSKGGINSVENYQPMCVYCNSQKGNCE